MKKSNPLNLNKKKVIDILVDMVIDGVPTREFLENHSYPEAQKIIRENIEHLLGDGDD